MLQFAAGDVEAFDKLVRGNTSKVHALILHFLGSDEQAEDLTQEVFLRVYRTARRYKPAAKFSTWLYRIVANLSFNAMRVRRRNQRRLDGLPGDDEQPGQRSLTDGRAENPAGPLMGKELAGQVAQALANLPDNQRVATVLSKYEGKDYRQIAEILECSTMAVKSLLSRARANLQSQLADYLTED